MLLPILQAFTLGPVLAARRTKSKPAKHEALDPNPTNRKPQGSLLGSSSLPDGVRVKGSGSSSSVGCRVRCPEEVSRIVGVWV